MNEPIKTCTKCGKTLPITTEYFHRDRARKDGFRSACKDCIEFSLYRCEKCGYMTSINRQIKEEENDKT